MEFELEAQRLLDERGSVLSAELHQHFVSCPECFAFWQSQQMIVAATGSWTRIMALPDFTPSVLTALSQPEHANFPQPQTPRQPRSVSTARQRVSQGSAWAALCSTAALMLLTVTIVRLSPLPEPSTLAVAVATPAAAGDSEEASVSQTLAGLWQGVHTEYQELSQETSRVLEGLGELPESAVLLPPLPAAESSSTDKPPPSWLRLARPVSDRVGQAFDFLRDAVPGETPQSS